MLLNGRQIGRYQLMELIGNGTMGEVYRAKDLQIDRIVAVKVLRVVDGDTEFRSQREVQAIGKLDHPNILPLYDYGQWQIDEELIYYMIMPLCPEDSLDKWRKRRYQNVALPLDFVTHFIQQAAHALQYAHDNHVIHRDVKPANFLVRFNVAPASYPAVLLADFSIVKFINTNLATIGVQTRGTPFYMAPEVWNEEKSIPDTEQPKIDQYALAITVYELLTGHFPFDKDEHGLAYHHTNTLPKPPSYYVSTLPSAVDGVILHALAKDPIHRYPSIAEFAQAFEKAVRSTEPGKPIHVTVAVNEAEALIGCECIVALPKSQNRQIAVRIPARTQHGTEITLESQGELSSYGGPNGPLIVTVAIKPSTEHDQVIKGLQHLHEGMKVLPSRSDLAMISAPIQSLSAAIPGRMRFLLALQILLILGLLVGMVFMSIGYLNINTAYSNVLNQLTATRVQIADVKAKVNGIILPAGNNAPLSVSTCGSVSDEFTNQLSSAWKLSNFGGNANYKIIQGNLNMSIQPGDIHDLNPSGLMNAPYLIQPILGDFTIVVHNTSVNFAPVNGKYQGTGILIWQDRGHFLRLEVGSSDKNNSQVSFTSYGFNVRSPLPGSVPLLTQFDLVLHRSGNSFTAYWRTLAQSWQSLGTINVPFTSIWAGLDMINTSPTTGIAATYDYFQVSCLSA